MKIRNGFVSNSSASSFLIYGTVQDVSEFEEDPEGEFEEKFAEAIEKEGLIIEYIPDREDIYVGKSWDSIKDNETGKEFKNKIEIAVHKIFGGTVECKTYSEAWCHA